MSGTRRTPVVDFGRAAWRGVLMLDDSLIKYQWMGACIGQTTCQVITGCPTSSIWLDCW